MQSSLALLRRARGPLLVSISPSSSPFLLTTKRGLANKVFDSAAEAIHDIKDGTSNKKIKKRAWGRRGDGSRGASVGGRGGG